MRLRHLAVRVRGENPGHAGSVLEALTAGAAPELVMTALVEDIEGPGGWSSTRAWYAELRAQGRMHDLTHKRHYRRVRGFGEILVLEIVQVRSRAWAQIEWEAMTESLRRRASHPLAEPIPIEPVWRQHARALEEVLRAQVADRPLRFWTMGSGTFGRLAAELVTP
jgi:hypothetical protein